MRTISSLNPGQKWQEQEILIPLIKLKVSLRSMMMSGLANFILFMGKQLMVMIKHPGAAAFELFPKIRWIADEEEEPVQEHEFV